MSAIVGKAEQFVARAPDGTLWLLAAKNTEDGLGAEHEDQPAGRSVHDYILSQLPDGGVFLDVGAHVGHYAIRAAVKGATVYAVEANPATIGRLIENAGLNKVELNIWAVAAWSEHAALSLFVPDPTLPLRAGGTRVGEGTGGVTVAALPLGPLMEPIDQLDLMKMDIEGAEIHALKGMHGQLCRLRPAIVIEDHSALGITDPADMRDAEHRLTRDAGYKWADIADLGVEGACLNYRVGHP